MTGPAFRFLHASDLHLDAPLVGLAEVPDGWRELLAQAPWSAAQRVFEAALRERVDFLLLCGDLLDTRRCSTRSLAFLLEQFERMDASGIAVYWATGETDTFKHWPSAVKLPGSVQVFPASRAEELTHFHEDAPVATLVGRSGPCDIAALAGKIDQAGQPLFSIAVAQGEVDREVLADDRVDYWALGGLHNRLTDADSKRELHYPGTPQGRSRDEEGPHGCTLVHVNDERQTRTQHLATDMVRRHRETLPVDDVISLEGLQKLLAQRVEHLRATSDDRPLLVSWHLQTDGPGLTERRQRLDMELLPWLRQQFSEGPRGVWSVEIDVTPFELPSAWKKEDSMLGEYLRAMSQLDDAEDPVWDWDEQLPERHRDDVLPIVQSTTTPAERRPLVQDASLLGAQLLGAGERTA
jgi:DNA repair exonuclease SbcCD nuclease subunit